MTTALLLSAQGALVVLTALTLSDDDVNVALWIVATSLFSSSLTAFLTSLWWYRRWRELLAIAGARAP